MDSSERTSQDDRAAFIGFMQDMRPWEAVGHGLTIHAHRLEQMEIPEDHLDPDPDKEAWCRAQDRNHFKTLYEAIKSIEDEPREALTAALSLDSPFLAYVSQYLGMVGALCGQLEATFAEEFRSQLVAASMPEHRGPNHRRIIRVWLAREGFEPKQSEADSMWLRALNRSTNWVDVDEIRQLHELQWLPSPAVAAEILSGGIPKHEARIPTKLAALDRTILTLSAIASRYPRLQAQQVVGL